MATVSSNLGPIINPNTTWHTSNLSQWTTATTAPVYVDSDIEVLRKEMEILKQSHLNIAKNQDERICELEEVVGELRDTLSKWKKSMDEYEQRRVADIEANKIKQDVRDVMTDNEHIQRQMHESRMRELQEYVAKKKYAQVASEPAMFELGKKLGGKYGQF